MPIFTVSLCCFKQSYCTVQLVSVELNPSNSCLEVARDMDTRLKNNLLTSMLQQADNQAGAFLQLLQQTKEESEM